ncbi:hypothetical protein D3C81_1934210 [compost metagenome]
MPSTLTLGGKDGKQSKKIERNTRERVFIEILLLRLAVIVLLFARGLSGAQLMRWYCRTVFGACEIAIASKLAPTGTAQSL